MNDLSEQQTFRLGLVMSVQHGGKIQCQKCHRVYSSLADVLVYKPVFVNPGWVCDECYGQLYSNSKEKF